MPSWRPAGAAQARVLELASLRMSEVWFAPSLYLDTHEHERDTIAITLAGGLQSIARKVDESNQGSASVEPAGDKHACRFGPRGARILVIQPHSLDDGCLDLKFLFSERRWLRDRTVAAAALRLAAELREPDSSTPLIAEGLALEILGHGNRVAALATGRQRRPRWLDRAEEVLRATFRAPTPLRELALTVGVHPVHLQRVFRAHHGMPIGEYQRRLRVEWAARRLSSSKDALIDIALDAGFADQSHFTRTFVRALGVSPQRYRQEQQR